MDLFLKFAPIVISIIALYFSFKAIHIQVPKLIVTIDRPNYDCFYGASMVREEYGQYSLSQYVAVIRLSLKNVSGTAMFISKIQLNYNGISYDLAGIDNPHWSEIEIYFPDKDHIDPEGHGFTTDGSYIDYKACGVELPIKIEPYGIKECCAVFINFPKNAKGSIDAELCVETAKNCVKKKVKLLHYDEDFQTEEWEDIQKFQRSY